MFKKILLSKHSLVQAANRFCGYFRSQKLKKIHWHIPGYSAQKCIEGLKNEDASSTAIKCGYSLPF